MTHNLSRAQIESDRKDDFINNFNARYGYQKVLNAHSLLNIFADIAYERVSQFKALNNLQFGGAVNYYYQPVTGFFSPWLEATFRLNALKFNDSQIRDSIVLEASLKVAKRLTNKFTGSMAYAYKERYSDGDVFDLGNHILAADMEYGYSRTLTLCQNKKRFGCRCHQ